MGFIEGSCFQESWEKRKAQAPKQKNWNVPAQPRNVKQEAKQVAKKKEESPLLKGALEATLKAQRHDPTMITLDMQAEENLLKQSEKQEEPTKEQKPVAQTQSDEPFNFVIGRMREGGYLSAYSYGKQVMYGTAQEAEELCKFISKREGDEYQVFKISTCPESL